jgi:hypothetical protein
VLPAGTALLIVLGSRRAVPSREVLDIGPEIRREVERVATKLHLPPADVLEAATRRAKELLR